MRGGFLALAVAVFASLVAGAAGAHAQASDALDARVESVATMVGSHETVFEFDVYNCPKDQEILVTFKADEPDGTDLNTTIAAQVFGPTTGDRVQHLTLTTEGNFLVGLRWVGSGTVTCGVVTIPVEGSGTVKSLTGV